MLPEDGAALAAAGAGAGDEGPSRLLLPDDDGHDAVLGRLRLPVLMPESMVIFDYVKVVVQTGAKSKAKR